ncbi:MAG TPA: hypothetical protein VN524_19420 [Hyphomicrobiaceae bacterium]|nr:hypothetical protein [Hyphomicrobiaceae bacterium]
MGDYGLAALSGVLGGLQGLPQGMLNAQKVDQGQQHIDLLQQHLAQQQAQFNTELPGDAVSAAFRSKIDPVKGTATVPTHLVPSILADRQKEQAQEQEVKQGSAFAASLEPLAQNDPYIKALQQSATLGAGGTQKWAPLVETLRQHQLARQQMESGNRMMLAFLTKDMSPEQAAQFRAQFSGPEPPAGAPATTPAAPPPARVIQTGGEQPLPLTGPIPPGPPPPSRDPSLIAPGQRMSNALAEQNRAAAELPGVTVPGTAPSAPPAPSGGMPGYQQPSISFDPSKGTGKIDFHPTPPSGPPLEYVQAVNEARKLLAAGVDPKDPRWKDVNYRLDSYKTYVLPADAELRGRGTGIDRPAPTPLGAPSPAQPGAPSGAPEPVIPGKPLATGRPKPMNATETNKLQEVDSVLSGIDQVRAYMDLPEVARFRGGAGLTSSVKARGGQYLENKLGIPMMDPVARSAAAALANTQAEYRKKMYGVRVTQAESAILEPALAASLSDPGLPQKLADLERIMKNHRAEIEETAAANRTTAPPARVQPGNTPPPAPPPGAPPGGGARTIRVRDKANPNRKGSVTLQPGEALPPGVEEDR